MNGISDPWAVSLQVTQTQHQLGGAGCQRMSGRAGRSRERAQHAACLIGSLFFPKQAFGTLTPCILQKHHLPGILSSHSRSFKWVQVPEYREVVHGTAQHFCRHSFSWNSTQSTSWHSFRERQKWVLPFTHQRSYLLLKLQSYNPLDLFPLSSAEPLLIFLTHILPK